MCVLHVRWQFTYRIPSTGSCTLSLTKLWETGATADAKSPERTCVSIKPGSIG